MIAEFTGIAIRSSSAFLDWLTEQRGLPSVEQLEAMFEQAS